jgi:hypothetical protein
MDELQTLEPPGFVTMRVSHMLLGALVGRHGEIYFACAESTGLARLWHACRTVRGLSATAIVTARPFDIAGLFDIVH